MIGQDEDLERRLRRHYAALSAVPPTDVIDSARDRIDSRGRRPAAWPMRLAVAAAVATMGIGAVVMSGGTPRPAPSSPDLSSGPSAGPSAQLAGLAKGVVATVVRPFSIVSDRGVAVGQRVYIVDGPTTHLGKQSYLIQHWGDLDLGIRPNSDFGWLDADVVADSLRPVAVACPTGPLTVGGIAALQPFERIVCFGAEPIHLTPVTTREYQVSASSPTWLSGDGNVDFPIAFPYVVASAKAVPPLDPSRFYAVDGHFGDPDCDGKSDPIVTARCRQQFVVTAAVPADPPEVFLDGTWRRMAESPLAGRTGAASAWTGTEVLIWGGDAYDESTAEYVPDGAAYDPSSDQWRRLPAAPIGGRMGASGTWTGTVFLVWGGYERHSDTETPVVDGAMYDPARNRWSGIPAAPIDHGPAATMSVWTGSELVVFSARMSSGAAFDPKTGRWRMIADPPFDSGDSNVPGLVWTGTELIVIGYPVDDVERSMALAVAWNPATDRWRPLPEPGFLSMQGGPAVWTGREVVVLWEANRAFDPATERWRSIDNPCGAGGDLIWTGRYAIQGGRAFDVEGERCRSMPLEPERPGGGYREFGVDVWTGSELIRWSGGNGGDGAPRENDGVAFRPNE